MGTLLPHPLLAGRAGGAIGALTGDGDGAAIFAPVTDAERARGELDRLFGSDGVADPQRAAAAVAAGRRVSIVAGGPGTGKTYTVARIVALLLACADDRHPRVTARRAGGPTGKAAARMGEALDEALAGMPDEDVARIGELRAQTLHRLLGAREGRGGVSASAQAIRCWPMS